MPVTEETWKRIDQAWADRKGGGRVVDAIDYEADAIAQDQRNRVRIELRQYRPHWCSEESLREQKAQAANRFRAELERAMRGPAKTLAGLRAIELAREGSVYHLTREEQALAILWPHALERAIAAGRRGLDDVPGSWFEVRLYKPPPASPPRPDPSTFGADRRKPPPPPPLPPPSPQGSLF